jgi:signal transduction histidine kinase
VEAETSDLSDEQLRANRYELVSRLADDLAHEIKNPLNAIIINLEVLKVRVAKADVQGALDRAGVIEHEVRRLHHLVDRMLLLVRPEREETSSVPLDSALDELLPLIEAQTRLARNEFHTECDGAVVVPVRRDVLKFALLNLLVAAHGRLGEGGGTLSVRCITDELSVRIVVEAIETSPGPPDAAAAADMAAASRTAAALLADSGGRIDPVAAGVSVSLPRTGSD